MARMDLVEGSIVLDEKGQAVQNFTVRLDKETVDLELIGKMAAEKSNHLVYEHIWEVMPDPGSPEPDGLLVAFRAMEGKIADENAVKNFLRVLNLGIHHL